MKSTHWFSYWEMMNTMAVSENHLEWNYTLSWAETLTWKLREMRASHLKNILRTTYWVATSAIILLRSHIKGKVSDDI